MHHNTSIQTNSEKYQIRFTKLVVLTEQWYSAIKEVIRGHSILLVVPNVLRDFQKIRLELILRQTFIISLFIYIQLPNYSIMSCKNYLLQTRTYYFYLCVRCYYMKQFGKKAVQLTLVLNYAKAKFVFIFNILRKVKYVPLSLRLSHDFDIFEVLCLLTKIN